MLSTRAHCNILCSLLVAPRPRRSQHDARNYCSNIATHCNALQRTATHCNILLSTFLVVSRAQGSEHGTHGKCSTLQHTATHCSTLQHALTHCNVLLPFLDATRPRRPQRNSPGNCRETAKNCNTLQHTATHCNMLQHTAPFCHQFFSSQPCGSQF